MEIPTPGIVLASYAEPVLDGRRAIIFGDSTSPLAEEALGRGARSVHVCDQDAARAGESAARNRSRQISIVPLGDADVAVRQGAFDVAIVEDLSEASDATALLKQVRRALSPRGVAFIASPNPDVKGPLVPRTRGGRAGPALGYYELYDKVAAEFQDVRMLGQTPFVGYAIVDFAPRHELDVEVDSEFLPAGAEEPEWFIAVAAREPVELGAFSIVQLPASRVVGSGTDGKLAEELRASRAAEGKLNDKIATLEAENSKLVADRRSQKSAADLRTKELLSEIETKNARLVDLEAQKAGRDAALKEQEEALEALRTRAAEAVGLKEDRESAVAERDRLAAALRAAEAEIAADKEAEISKLEGLLTERGGHVRKLEADLKEAERVGRELVKELAREAAAESAAPDGSEDGAKSAELDVLTAENTRLRADLQAAEWTIQELEHRLDHAARRAGDGPTAKDGAAAETDGA
jgi:SAM-dependent methyltransferase